MLEQILQDLSSYPTVMITVGSGLENWRTGEISLMIKGTGDIQIHNKRAGKQREFSATKSAEWVQTFGRFLVEHQFNKSRTSDKLRPPGDVPVWMKVAHEDKVLFEINLWHADRNEDDNFDAILEFTDDLIEEITDGELPFGKS